MLLLLSARVRYSAYLHVSWLSFTPQTKDFSIHVHTAYTHTNTASINRAILTQHAPKKTHHNSQEGGERSHEDAGGVNTPLPSRVTLSSSLEISPRHARALQQLDDSTATDPGAGRTSLSDLACVSDAYSPPSPHTSQQADAQDELDGGANMRTLSSPQCNTSPANTSAHSTNVHNPNALGSQRLRDAWVRHAAINWGGDLSRQMSWLNTTDHHAFFGADLQAEADGDGTVAAWMRLSNIDCGLPPSQSDCVDVDTQGAACASAPSDDNGR
jgi:hypothetical protein